MRRFNCLIPILAAFIIGLVGFGCATPGDNATPPVARVEPKVDTMFGNVMVDNYFWLRGKEKPEVIEYLDAENAYTEAVMAHTTALQDKLYAELKGRIKETDLSVPVKHGDYYYYFRDEEGKQYKIYCRKMGTLDAAEEILLDINLLAEGHGFMKIGTYQISPDHNLLAYATDTLGNERYLLFVKDLRTGEIYSDRIDNISGDVEWANDNKTLLYTVPDDAWRPHKLYRHVLGTPIEKDVLVYEEVDEMYWMEISHTRSEQYILIESGSKLTSEVQYLDANKPTDKFGMIAKRDVGVEYKVEHHGNKFYIVTNLDALNFRLMEAPVRNPGRKNWKEVIPHSDAVMINGVSAFKDFLVISKREDGLTAIGVWNLANGEKYDMQFTEPVYTVHTSDNPDFNQTKLRFSYESMITPKSIYDFDMKSRERELMKQTEVLGGYNPDEYQSERIFATARDGETVPISLVYKKGMQKNGHNPLWLYAYGSYGGSSDPWFSSNRVSLLDRGFIYAIAHVRGGDEMGRRWYDDGKLMNKKNTFTDFIDCADHLVAEKFTDSEHLVISGGSAGGLLMGAVVNMRPELFKACLASVPFVDVVNTMLDATIPLTVVEYEEWGNPNEEEAFNYMMSYSPYDNVKAQEYPNLLIRAGLYDTRVMYWEPAKWTAKLRAMSTGNNRLLMKTNMGAGHGGASGRYDRYKKYAFDYAFALDCLGITE